MVLKLCLHFVVDHSQDSTAHCFLLHHTNTVMHAQQTPGLLRQHPGPSSLPECLSQGLYRRRNGSGCEMDEIVIFVRLLFS